MNVGSQNGRCNKISISYQEMKKKIFLAYFLIIVVLASCEKQKEHTASAIYERDSVSMMTSYGVNTLISDSGVIKYRIVTELWEVNTIKQPTRWIFEKGIFFEQFDEKFHIQSYIQCDTAYYFDQHRLWELRGRVCVLSNDGLKFYSEQLYWNQNKHELYSNVYSRLITPERTLEGSYFRSNEQMTKYYVSNSKGSFEKNDFTSKPDTTQIPIDTIKPNIRPQSKPQPKTSNSLDVPRTAIQPKVP